MVPAELRGRRWAAVAAVLVALSTPGSAQTPLGPQFLVNGGTAYYQSDPAVAVNAAGDFLVVWEGSGSYGDGSDIFARRFDRSGSPLGADFQITAGGGYDTAPAVAADGSGGFVVVWSGRPDVDEPFHGYGQRLDASGGPVGGRFSISSDPDPYFQEFSPAVAAAGTSFVVAWQGYLPPNGSTVEEIFARRFGPAGAIGAQFQVNTSTEYPQSSPRVAMHSDGSFVVVWDDAVGEGANRAVRGQRFDATGAPVGAEFGVTAGLPLPDQHDLHSDVAATGGGSFVVTWESAMADEPPSIAFQRFDASAPLGSPVSLGGGSDPRVTADAVGNFVVVRRGGSILGSVFDAAGDPIGAEFEVTADDAYEPIAIDLNDAGEFVVAWSAYLGIGASDVFARQFGLDVTPTPTPTLTPTPTVTPQVPTATPGGPTVTPEVPPTVTPAPNPTATSAQPPAATSTPGATPTGPAVTPAPGAPDVRACDAIDDTAESGEQTGAGRFCVANRAPEPIFVTCTDVDFEEPELFVAGFVHGTSGAFEARAKAVPGRPSEFCFDPPLQIEPGGGAEFDLTVSVAPPPLASAVSPSVVQASVLPGRLALGFESLLWLSLVVVTAPTKRSAVARLVLAIAVLGVAALGGCDGDDDPIPIRGVSTQRLVDVRATGPIGGVDFTGLPVTLGTLEVR